MKTFKIITILAFTSIVATGIKAFESEEEKEGWYSDASEESIPDNLFESVSAKSELENEECKDYKILPIDEEQKERIQPAHVPTRLEALTVEGRKASQKDEAARAAYKLAQSLVESSTQALAVAKSQSTETRQNEIQSKLEVETREAEYRKAQSVLNATKAKMNNARRRNKKAILAVKKADTNTTQAEQNIISARLTLDKAGLIANQTTLIANKLRTQRAEARPKTIFGYPQVSPEDAISEDCYTPTEEQKNIALHREKTKRVVGQVRDYHTQKAKIEQRLAKK